MISVQRPSANSDPAEQIEDGVIDVRRGAVVRRHAEARAHDHNAVARDQAAAERDSATAQREDVNPGSVVTAVSGPEAELQAAEQRGIAPQYASATRDRASAPQDRIAALKDRARAPRDRSRAMAGMEALTRDLAMTETDELTGATSRGPELAALEQEVKRCRLENGMLAIACVDVVGLKAINDTDGHEAGDVILERVVTQMRADDLIIRSAETTSSAQCRT